MHAWCPIIVALLAARFATCLLIESVSQQQACAPHEDTLPGLVNSYSPSFGGSVFPPKALVFRTGCSNYAEDWNIAAQWLIRETSKNGNEARDSPRVFAMLHLAQWQALRVNEESNNPVNPNALIAFVSHFILSNRYPQYYYRYDALIQEQVAAFSDAEVEAARAAAKPIVVNLISARLYDGSQDVATFLPAPPGGPIGEFQDVPGSYIANDLAQFATARGFLIPSPISEFAPMANNKGPPPLPSPDYNSYYTAGFLLGASNSTVRTTYQTETAYFWFELNETCGPFGHWNQIALNTMASNTTLDESATLLARLNVALYDTFITVWAEKYKWKRWRPITAIREGDCKPGEHHRTNGCHEPVPSWTPLLVTPDNPVYPSWPGGCAGASEAVLNDWHHAEGNRSFSIGTETITPWGYLPGRTYKSFTQAALEVCNSRVYGGVELNNDALAGRTTGRAVAEYVLDSFSQLDPTSPDVVGNFQHVQEAFDKVTAKLRNSSIAG